MKILLKWKKWRIEAAAKTLVEAEGYEPIVLSFGSYDIDPKHLVFVVLVPTDEEKHRLKEDTRLIQSLHALLVRFGWPQKARKHVVFDIESRETVLRESNGNVWLHFR